MTDQPARQADLRVLIAPDSYGDTLTAVAAAAAIERGWTRARPGDTVVAAPQSDGGPGFVDVLATRFGEVLTETVAGPSGNRVAATWLLDRQATPVTAYVESAQACGLSLVPDPPTRRSALTATTHGVGELVAAALRHEVGRIVIGLGGSATTDGGRGLIEALGGGEAARRALADVDLVMAADVTNHLLGQAGAAAVFGPQKGADRSAVAELEQRLTAWSQELARIAGRGVADDRGAGAAGGLGAALLALGARQVPGARLVAEATDRGSLMSRSDLVLTGEGRFDSQTLRGKVIASLATSARYFDVPTVVLAGQVALSAEQIRAGGIAAAYQIVDVTGSVSRAMSEAEAGLSRLAEQVARAWPAPAELTPDMGE